VGATKDKTYADRLRARAATALEQAEQAREAVSDLNPLLADLNSQQVLKELLGLPLGVTVVLVPHNPTAT
jgi:hypothetical protein